MRYLSVCSGIEAASVAWSPLGWTPVMFSEIEAFPRAVLKHRHLAVDASETGAAQRGVPLWGDFTAIRPRHFRRLGIDLPDLLVGGTPCQGFSIAGLRGSLYDDRSNLCLQFVRLAHALRNSVSLRWVVWENVPGVINVKDNAFGCFLAGLAGAYSPLRSPLERGRWPDAGMVSGPRGRISWRILDAQHFGLAQRRRRVFVVAGFGDADPAAVLFERQGVHRDTPARSKKREVVAAITSTGADDNQAQAGHIIAHTLRSEGFDASEDGTGRGTPLVPVAYGGNNTGGPIDVASCLNAKGGSGRMDFESETLIAFNAREDPCVTGDVTGALGSSSPQSQSVLSSGVRRITPREAEALQGFPTDYTLIPMGRRTPGNADPDFRAYIRLRHPGLSDDEISRLSADGPRYKALGNSMAVPVMRWIGERIALYESQHKEIKN